MPHEEIARQDVMITPQGPVELMRKDQYGNSVMVPRHEARQISQQCHKPRPHRRPYNPMITRHGPGLYRNHQMVRGDSIEVHTMPTREYIYHRRPFDWYNTCRFDLIDDIEEILEPSGHQYEKNDFHGAHAEQYKHHNYVGHFESENRKLYRDYDYDSHQDYAHRAKLAYRNQSGSRSRSRNCEDDTIYVVKKKSEPQKSTTISPAPEIRYYEPHSKPAASNITSVTTTHQPIKYSGPQVIYHGQTDKKKEDYNYNLTGKLVNSGQTNYRVGQSSESFDVKQLLVDLQTLVTTEKKKRGEI